MAVRLVEMIDWLRDVREYLIVSKRRKSLRQPGQGTDYTGDRFDGLVSRVVSKYHPRRMRLKVVEIVQETPSTKTLRFERLDGPVPPFRAGQYINLYMEVDGVRTSRPYSISSAPGRDRLDLTVQHKPGGFVASYLFNDVKCEDEFETTGPRGHFYYEPLIDGQDLVFLAGGSGTTPFMSMTRTLLEKEFPGRILLLHGSRLPEEAIFAQDLAELAERHPNFEYALVISEPPEGHDGLSGLLDADMISDQVGEIIGKTFYVCGPYVMYDFCLRALGELGVPVHKIRTEVYGPPPNVTQEPGWPDGLSGDHVFEVEVEGREGIHVPAGEPLMNSLERYGIVLKAECRSGSCSACRIKLISGKVFMLQQAGVRESDLQHGFIHACVAYPLENLKIRI